MDRIGIGQARRLALARAGLLKPEWTGFPKQARGNPQLARKAAYAVIRRLGYLQIDTVAVAGARSHAIVLLSRLENLDPILAEALLQPREPLFEYWGHEASWLPMALYPLFEFRRKAFRTHPWWGDLIGQHPETADAMLQRIRAEGPLRSVDLESRASSGWWDLSIAKKVASALWSCGELAVRERVNFQRTYDLTERVIPDEFRLMPIDEPQALEQLLLLALQGHGWADARTLAQTWRLNNRKTMIDAALQRLHEKGMIAPCLLDSDGQGKVVGWIRPEDLALAERLKRIRPCPDKGVLLSPFDPVLWDRARVALLFDFHQVLEIFKPAPKRKYGYYCLPVLAGDRLVARVDIKADKKQNKLHILSLHIEPAHDGKSRTTQTKEAVRTALIRYAQQLQLSLAGNLDQLSQKSPKQP